MLDAVDEPISRTVYDYILRSPHLEHLFDVLQSRASVRLITRQGHKPMYSETDENIMQVCQKLLKADDIYLPNNFSLSPIDIFTLASHFIHGLDFCFKDSQSLISF